MNKQEKKRACVLFSIITAAIVFMANIDKLPMWVLALIIFGGMSVCILGALIIFVIAIIIFLLDTFVFDDDTSDSDSEFWKYLLYKR